MVVWYLMSSLYVLFVFSCVCVFCQQLNAFPQKAQKVMFGVQEEDREKSRMGHQMKLNI